MDRQIQNVNYKHLLLEDYQQM